MDYDGYLMTQRLLAIVFVLFIFVSLYIGRYWWDLGIAIALGVIAPTGYYALKWRGVSEDRRGWLLGFWVLAVFVFMAALFVQHKIRLGR